MSIDAISNYLIHFTEGGNTLEGICEEHSLADHIPADLYPIQKYDSDTERRFSVIFENDKSVTKLVKPGKGNFRIHYTAEAEYEPDFVAETADAYYLCEPKDESEMDDTTVQAKARAAAQSCKHATGVSSKPWKYLLIPHTAVDESKSLAGLAAQYTVEAE
jgi:type III restriction enzyme